MYLKKIKLAGFKSFVEPTVIPFRSELTAILGPNGCGKSNVIDAIRWVLGESSAKHIRGGDSIAEVIFSGSRDRKPLSQASVELVFDNQQGRLGGEYAQYREISVRRLVTRDGQSSYFLNGVKCRRKDIIHIFLGTGLGPRSYAIIQQGTVSRLIDAKPEELRLHFEEVAGISKYKERRRETMVKLKHTEENLSRVNDLADELDQQLKKLKKQAKEAEQYRTLKKEERHTQAHLSALRWREDKDRVASFEQAVAEGQLALEALQRDKHHCEKEIIQWREQQTTANDAFNEAQASYYQLESEIKQLEHQIQAQTKRLDELLAEQKRVKIDQEVTERHRVEDTERVQQLEQQQQAIAPELERVRLDVSQQQEQSHALSQQCAALAKTHEQAKGARYEAEREVSNEAVREQHLQQQQARISQQRQASQDSAPQFDLEQQQAQLEQMQQQLQERVHQEQHTQQHTQQQETELQQLEAHHRSLLEQRSHLEVQLRQTALALTRHEATMAAQHQSTGDPSSWLEQQQLQHQPRLGACLDIEPGWEHAVETVLGQDLLAVCIDDLQTVWSKLPRMPLTLIGADLPAVAPSSDGLLAQIKQPHPVLTLWLADVHTAANRDDALEKIKSLPQGACVVTPEGDCVGHHWVRLQGSGPAEGESRLDMLKTIESLKHELHALESQADAVREALQTAEHDLCAQKDALQAARQAHQQALVSLKDLQSSVQQHQSRMTHQQQQLTQHQQDMAQWEQQQSEIDTELKAVRQRHAQAKEVWQQKSEREAQLMQEHQAAQGQQRTQDEVVKRITETLRDLELSHHKMAHELATCTQNLQRAITYQEQLQDREDQLQTQMTQLQASKTGEDQLQQTLVRYQEAEQQVLARRQISVKLERQLADLEASRSQHETKLQQCQAGIQQSELEIEGSRVRRTSLQEQLVADGYVLETLLDELEPGATCQALEQVLSQLARRIQQLGAINLAAIDEYQVESERRERLAAQHQDLSEALATLQSAMKKIDLETKNLFKSTFETVNRNFSQYFPKLFGGGQASLVLSSDDLLESGVSITAKPPGKRIANLQALSGGEKALTAVALVLSLFQLNPAPFCLLDEVDAPLDDANVHRFCDVIRDMSKNVQFIFITHNKITMSLAHQLAGVTMSEPGVSRLVTVDLETALAKIAS